MKILVVGGGGREHAIVMKLAESPQVEALYCAPGNGGIAKYAKCFPVKATDIDGMVKLAKELAVDLVFVAPDDPLVLGLWTEEKRSDSGGQQGVLQGTDAEVSHSDCGISCI